MITINSLTKEYADAVIDMMRTFYSSPAVSTNGSEEIFRCDVEQCISDNPYLEGYVFIDGKKAAPDLKEVFHESALSL